MKKSNIIKTVSCNIRFYRKQKGWSQEKLAEQCNLHRTYIGAIERGEKNLTLKSLEVIALALEVETPILLTEHPSTACE